MIKSGMRRMRKSVRPPVPSVNPSLEGFVSLTARGASCRLFVVKSGFIAWVGTVFAAALLFTPWLHPSVAQGDHGACAHGCAHDPVGDDPDRPGGHSPDDCPACHFAKAGAVADAPIPLVPPPHRMVFLPRLMPVRCPAARSSVRLPPSCGPPLG